MKPSPQQVKEEKALAPFRNRWTGKTVACLASGPSLTREDVEKVRHLPCLVTNTTFRSALWAEVLVGHDAKWWDRYQTEVDQTFSGLQVTCARGRRGERLHSLADAVWLCSFRNTGAIAIALAAYGGASRVLMLGFDCQKTDGQTHHHGDHPHGLSNGASIREWPKLFANVSRYTKDRSEVWNCTRQTLLTCFPRKTLEAVL